MQPEAQAQQSAQANNQPPLNLTYNDLVGAMQRMLSETHAYLGQPVPLINPIVVLDMLERIAQFNSRLPLPNEREGAPN